MGDIKDLKKCRFFFPFSRVLGPFVSLNSIEVRLIIYHLIFSLEKALTFLSSKSPEPRINVSFPF